MPPVIVGQYQYDEDIVRMPAQKRREFLAALSDHFDMAGKLGAAAAGVTAVEKGDGYRHVSVLTVNTTLPAIAGGANLAVGKLLYTLPAGRLLINAVSMTLAITQTEGNINADTPDDAADGWAASGDAAALLTGTVVVDWTFLF